MAGQDGGIVTGIFAKNAGLDGAKADRVAGVISDLFATAQVIPRAGQTDDIAQGAVYLASDAASFVAGHDLVIDGGFVPFCKYGFDDAVAADDARHGAGQCGNADR
jgi:gluconate 5-dehydrogenase